MPYAHLFQALTSHLNILIERGGYFVIFLSSVLEGIPLVGMVVPGHVVILASGFIAKIGILSLIPVLIIASLGAIIGDYIGFTIGRRYGMRFIEKFRPYFFIKDSYIEKARELLSKHTGKAMIVGRFSPVTRALMPFLVGCSNTHVKKFWIFNIIGGVSWVISSVLVGYLFGAGYHAVAGYFGKFILIALLCSILIVWGYRFVNARFNIFRRYELFALILNIIAFFALFKTIEDTWVRMSFMAGFDVWLNSYMANHVTPFMANIAYIVTNAGGTVVLMILGMIIGLVFLFKKKWRSGSIMIISIMSSAFFIASMKELFLRVRPENALHQIVNDPSFPSGHAGIAAAFFTVLVYLFAPKFNSWIKREIFIVLSVVAVIMIGFSRLVLNVHWFSDVLAGWSLGIFCATSTILIIRYVGVLVLDNSIGNKINNKDK